MLHGVKPTYEQLDIDRVRWQIGLQAWEYRMPRWVPDIDLIASPVVSVLLAGILALCSLLALSTLPIVGPNACTAASILGALALFAGFFAIPRFARVRGPALVLVATPTHLEISADWPYVPADQLTAALSGLGWKEAGGRRIPWSEIRGVRLSKSKRHLQFKLLDDTVLELPVAGSRRWDRTLRRIARDLDERCRRVSSGQVPEALRALRQRE